MSTGTRRKGSGERGCSETRAESGWAGADQEKRNVNSQSPANSVRPLFRINPTNLKESVPRIKKNANPDESEIMRFCLIEICAPTSVAAGVGEPVRPGSSRPPARTSPATQCVLVLAGRRPG